MLQLKYILLAFLFFAFQINAQLSLPIVESVFGGRILDISGFAKTADTSRIFISTESANSVFYVDVYSNTTSPMFSNFNVMPGIDANAGFGSAINSIEAHENSGYLFFISNNEIISSTPTSSSTNLVYSSSSQIRAIDIIEDYLFFVVNNDFHFGTLDASALFTEDVGSPISLSSVGGLVSIEKNPITDMIYIFGSGTVPNILILSDTYNSLNSASTSATITVSVSSGKNWTAFGIAPDGTLLISGNDGTDKYLAYLDATSTWNEIPMGVNGVSGNNFAFNGDSTSYNAYTAKAFSNNTTIFTNWNTLGMSGFETHPNDGAVYVDPINENIIYLTTDQGIGASIDNGNTIFEIDNGVEAVMVADFSMMNNKTSAWLASKSGIRKVINYTTSPMWTNAIFPNGDGSPYYSAEMSKDDTNRVFVGNVRIYKTDDNGNNWTKVFTPENSPYNFPNIGTKALAIEECNFSPNIVMAGFEIWNTDKGGLFVSVDYGANWTQILLEAASVGQDVDVSDIIFVQEGSDTVAYVSALYDLSLPQGRSIYKVVKNGSTWNATQDMGPTGTAVGYSITATIWDLELTSTGDTIYATGTDAGINHPISYYKTFSGTGLWTTMTTSGYPFSAGKEATAITVGIDTIYVAVDNEIYYFALSDTNWNLGYSYPVGSRINFLYYDELLAGTDLGLYAHFGTTVTTVENKKGVAPDAFELEQNYPNPFNPSTVIKYSIPNVVGTNFATTTNVKLIVYDILGREVATLVNKEQQPGNYSVKFDASQLTSGIYFYKLNVNQKSLVKKMMLLK